MSVHYLTPPGVEDEVPITTIGDVKLVEGVYHRPSDENVAVDTRAMVSQGSGAGIRCGVYDFDEGQAEEIAAHLLAAIDTLRRCWLSGEPR